MKLVKWADDDGVVHMRKQETMSDVLERYWASCRAANPNDAMSYGRNEGPPHSAYVPKAKDK